ncbi:MAG: hypothetical protein EOM90_11275 [Alphaproteobacteria bacterium]|nr:hypothetical protein [Alphaproteobacteria bacterium]
MEKHIARPGQREKQKKRNGTWSADLDPGLRGGRWLGRGFWFGRRFGFGGWFGLGGLGRLFHLRGLWGFGWSFGFLQGCFNIHRCDPAGCNRK